MLVDFEFFCCFALDTDQDELTEDYSATFKIKGNWSPAELPDYRELGYSRGTPPSPAEFDLYDVTTVSAHNSRRGVVFSENSTPTDKALAAWLAERFSAAVDSHELLRARVAAAAADTAVEVGV